MHQKLKVKIQRLQPKTRKLFRTKISNNSLAYGNTKLCRHQKKHTHRDKKKKKQLSCSSNYSAFGRQKNIITSYEISSQNLIGWHNYMNSIHLSRIGNIFFDFYGSQAQKSLKSNSTKTHPKAPFHSYYIHFSLKVSEVGIYIRCSIQPISVYSGFVLNLHPIIYSLLK